MKRFGAQNDEESANFEGASLKNEFSQFAMQTLLHELTAEPS